MMSEQSNKTALAVFNRMMEKDYCSQWMNIEPIVIEEGHCKIKMTVHQQMLNGFGILHGGIAYAFADSAFAFASNSYGRVSVSIAGNMTFAKSAKEGMVLIAEAKVLSLNYKTADFDVDVYEEQSSDIFYRFRGTVYRSSKMVLVEEN